MPLMFIMAGGSDDPPAHPTYLTCLTPACLYFDVAARTRFDPGAVPDDWPDAGRGPGRSATDPTPPAGDHASHAAHAGHGLFDTHEASGTSWVPATTPMTGPHVGVGRWDVMLHGVVFLQYLHEFAPIHRGAHQFGSINWFMAMARRPLAGGRVGARTMISLEPWTIPGCGYPDLLATGELCDGDGLHDRQHPHDLFMEVAAEYARPMHGGLAWHVYGGPAGEPALGPPAFPHRRSAMPNPVAPITHHWLDSTHIAFGVVTAGVSGARWRAEASAFNGREPDEARHGFDLAPLDSFAARLSLRPHPTIALQVSAGRLESAEQEFAGGTRYDIARLTASASYERPPPRAAPSPSRWPGAATPSGGSARTRGCSKAASASPRATSCSGAPRSTASRLTRCTFTSSRSPSSR